jgi:hypothetical protein
MLLPPKNPLMAEGIAKAFATADVTADVEDAAALMILEADVDCTEEVLARTSLSYRSEMERAGDTSDESSEAIEDSAGVRREFERSESAMDVCFLE